MPKISVVIVNYNVKDFLSNAIDSISKSLSKIESEIFVVDNNSNDGSVDLIKKKFPKVNLIENKENVGFAVANNQAIKRVNGDFIVLINPDTIVQENTFEELINFFDSHSEVGLATCKVLNPDGTLQLACRRSFPTPWIAFTKIFGLSTLFPNSKIFAKYNLTFLDSTKAYEVDAVSGSFMFLRKSVIEKIGGFDEDFFMYGEDLDFCYRIKDAGWKIYYVPTTSIIHYKGESTKRSNIDDLKIFYSAMKIYFHKHSKTYWLFDKTIELGIFLKHLLSTLYKYSKNLIGIFIDSLIVFTSLLIAEYLRKGKIITFPTYAYPWVFIFPILIFVSILYLFQVYTSHKLSSSRAFAGSLISVLIIISLTAIIKDFAFSRIILLTTGIILIFSISGWRLLLKITTKTKISSLSFFSSNTLIVGTNSSAENILNYLLNNKNKGFKIVGCLSENIENIGSKWNNIEVLGDFEMLEKIIEKYKISEVIVAKNSISFSKILDSRANQKNSFVNYHLTLSGDEISENQKISLDTELPVAPFTLKKSTLVNKIFYN